MQKTHFAFYIQLRQHVLLYFQICDWVNTNSQVQLSLLTHIVPHTKLKSGQVQIPCLHEY